MCIIVAKPMGAAMPDEETRARCFQSNPDGAGFMLADGKTVRIRKGYMRLEDFETALEKEMRGFDPIETTVVLHFRIATSGKVKPSTCHPFPISDEPEELRKTRMESRFGIAHNGVISGRYTADGWSDTMDFVADVVTPLMRMNPSFMHSSDAIELLEGACGSKLAIIDNAGDLALVGSFVEDGGVFYSNTTYLPTKYNWSSYGSLWEGGWDDYYEDKPWDDIGKLVEQLPHEACQLCPMNEDCAMWDAECLDEETAVKACAYYSGEEEEEAAGLFELC